MLRLWRWETWHCFRSCWNFRFIFNSIGINMIEKKKKEKLSFFLCAASCFSSGFNILFFSSFPVYPDGTQHQNRINMKFTTVTPSDFFLSLLFIPIKYWNLAHWYSLRSFEDLSFKFFKESGTIWKQWIYLIKEQLKSE